MQASLDRAVALPEVPSVYSFRDPVPVFVFHLYSWGNALQLVTHLQLMAQGPSGEQPTFSPLNNKTSKLIALKAAGGGGKRSSGITNDGEF